jgi:hypothetical protein
VRLQGDASAVPFSPSVCSLAAWLEVSVLSPSVELRWTLPPPVIYFQNFLSVCRPCHSGMMIITRLAVQAIKNVTTTHPRKKSREKTYRVPYIGNGQSTTKIAQRTYVIIAVSSLTSQSMDEAPTKAMMIPCFFPRRRLLSCSGDKCSFCSC